MNKEEEKFSGKSISYTEPRNSELRPIGASPTDKSKQKMKEFLKKFPGLSEVYKLNKRTVIVMTHVEKYCLDKQKVKESFDIIKRRLPSVYVRYIIPIFLKLGFNKKELS